MDEGDAIKAGRCWSELDHKPYKVALIAGESGRLRWHRRKYDLMLAGYRDEEIRSGRRSGRNRRKAAYDYAQNFYNRQQGLWKSRTISANDTENARSSRDRAQATLRISTG